jgi:hypothetical protein
MRPRERRESGKQERFFVFTGQRYQMVIPKRGQAMLLGRAQKDSRSRR